MGFSLIGMCNTFHNISTEEYAIYKLIYFCLDGYILFLIEQVPT